MRFSRFLIAGMGLTLGAGLLAVVNIHPAHAQAANAQTADAQSADIDLLRAEVDTLRRQLPDQAHVMSDVDYHYASLWFAGQNANWPLADFYLGETRSHLNWAVRVRPVRKLSSDAELDLRPILQGIESAGLTDIKSAIDKKDLRAFDLAYRGMMGQCYGCHLAAEKPYLKLRLPQSPGARMIDPRG